MAKTIEVVAVSTGIVGKGAQAHRVRPGTVFTIEEGTIARSWFVPTDPEVKLPLPERRAHRRALAAQEYEASQRELRKAPPTTYSEMTKASNPVTEMVKPTSGKAKSAAAMLE